MKRTVFFLLLFLLPSFTHAVTGRNIVLADATFTSTGQSVIQLSELETHANHKLTILRQLEHTPLGTPAFNALQDTNDGNFRDWYTFFGEDNKPVLAYFDISAATFEAVGPDKISNLKVGDSPIFTNNFGLALVNLKNIVAFHRFSPTTGFPKSTKQNVVKTSNDFDHIQIGSTPDGSRAIDLLIDKNFRQILKVIETTSKGKGFNLKTFQLDLLVQQIDEMFVPWVPYLWGQVLVLDRQEKTGTSRKETGVGAVFVDSQFNQVGKQIVIAQPSLIHNTSNETAYFYGSLSTLETRYKFDSKLGLLSVSPYADVFLTKENSAGQMYINHEVINAKKQNVTIKKNVVAGPTGQPVYALATMWEPTPGNDMPTAKIISVNFDEHFRDPERLNRGESVDVFAEVSDGDDGLDRVGFSVVDTSGKGAPCSYSLAQGAKKVMIRCSYVIPNDSKPGTIRIKALAFDKAKNKGEDFVTVLVD